MKITDLAAAMKHVYIIAAIVFFIYTIGYGNALSTVSLTGSCPSGQVINSIANTLIFNLTSTGNYNPKGELYINLGGAETINQSVTLTYLKESSIPIAFPLRNLSSPGEYVGTFDFEYTQANQTLFAIFPCTYYIKKTDYPSIYITNFSMHKVSADFDAVKMNITNFGNTSLNVTIYPYYPADFNVSPGSARAQISPKSSISENFTVTPIGTYINGSFSVGFYAAYAINGLHYSTQPYPFTFIETTTKSYDFGSMIIYGVLAVIIIVACMIVVSLYKNRKKRS